MGKSDFSKIRALVKGSKQQLLTIPVEVSTDKTYPFKVGDRVLITIDAGHLIVEKANGEQ